MSYQNNNFEFRERKAAGKIFEDECEIYFKSTCAAVAKNGTEHTHPGFVDLLRNKDDLQSHLIRFAPDGVYLKAGQTIHWEAKASTNIEMDAYAVYMHYFNMGCKLIIYSKRIPSRRVYGQYVERMGFVPSDQVVSRFQNPFPIIPDGDWINPPKEMRKYLPGSGKPYKEIDYESMVEIPEFYKIVDGVKSEMV